jgi:hypothetical protein
MTTIFPAVKKTFLQMMGPSIIFIALSISGGEMLLWPHLVANYGFAILWPIPIILVMQFVTNLEIERYTLVTGKSVEKSLVGQSTWLAVIFAISVLAALVWPAWITTAGNLLSTILGFSEQAAKNAGLIISIILLLLSLIIFVRQKTYKSLELLTKIGVALALIIILIVVILKFDAASFGAAIKGFFSFGYLPADLSRFAFVGALAYGGVAGVLNLAQSEWIKDKGYGVNQTGAQPEAINYKSSESIANYKNWFRFINKEHFAIFFLGNIISILLLAYLGYLLVPMGSAQGFDILKNEITALNNYLPFLGTIFAVAGIAIFTMANITILDCIGRLVNKLLAPFKNPPSSSTISIVAVIIGVIILTLSLLIPNFQQPFFLLVTSAVVSAFTMWLYPPLLLKLNYQLPKEYQPSLWRSVIVLLTTLFYGAVTLWALVMYLPLWLIILLGVFITGFHVYIVIKIINGKS